jgi:uncharacterized protein (DUF1800 family)
MKRFAFSLMIPPVFLLAGGIASGSGEPEPPSDTATPFKSTWGVEQAAHLLRRAGFGGTPEQIAFLAQLGRDRAVDYLVDYDAIEYTVPRPAIVANPPRAPDGYRPADREERQRLAGQIKRIEGLGLREISAWWIQRMVGSPRPLEEKMVLFWHGHFTSGFREVKRSSMLGRQNEMFRRNATGNYRELLLDVSRDPAMLIYLNNNQNIDRKPNENYARELLELFTLGEGAYSEADIKAAARAFTGWSVDPRGAGRFVFSGRRHDWDEKTFLGETGHFDGTDIIDIVLKQPVAAEHLIRRLWLFMAGRDAPAEVVARLAPVFRERGYEIKPLLRAMLRLDAFYRDDVMFQQVRSPADLIVGTMRALEIAPEDCAAMSAAMRLMGQELFQPPNVKGWDGGLTWINTATLFNRYNLLGYMVHGTPKRSDRVVRRIEMAGMMAESSDDAASDELVDETMVDGEMMSDGGPTGDGAAMAAQPVIAVNDYIGVAQDLLRTQPPFDPTSLVRSGGETSDPSAGEIVDRLIARLLQRPIDAERRRILVDEFKRVARGAVNADDGEPERDSDKKRRRRMDAEDHANAAERATDHDAARRAEAVRGVIHLILSMPEYQLG